MELGKLSLDEFKRLKNVIVTLSPQGTRDVQLIGLFGGVMPITKTDTTLVTKDDMYICILKGTVIHFLSSLFYHIVQLDVSLDVSGAEMIGIGTDYLTPFNEKNQPEALSILKKIHEAMREEKRVTEYDMIDDETYTGVTEIQRQQIDTDGPVKNTTRSGGVMYGSEDYSQRHNPNACGYSHSTTTYVKKAVTTTTFSRSAKAAQEELNSMAAKLKALREGTYKAPDLPAIPADKVKENKGDEKKVVGTESQQHSQSSQSDDTQQELNKYNFFMCG